MIIPTHLTNLRNLLEPRTKTLLWKIETPDPLPLREIKLVSLSPLYKLKILLEMRRSSRPYVDYWKSSQIL